MYSIQLGYVDDGRNGTSPSEPLVSGFLLTNPDLCAELNSLDGQKELCGLSDASGIPNIGLCTDNI